MLFASLFVFFFLAWRLGKANKADCDATHQMCVQQSRHRSEEDSIIDNFLTLFHKLCAFKCLTRTINKEKRKKKMPRDGRLARSMCVGFAVAECYVSVWKEEPMELGMVCFTCAAMTNYRKA